MDIGTSSFRMSSGLPHLLGISRWGSKIELYSVVMIPGSSDVRPIKPLGATIRFTQDIFLS